MSRKKNKDDKKIIVFQSIEEAVSKLNSFNNNFTFPQKDRSKNYIIKNCIGSNIYRAFPISEGKPSVVIQNWIKENFDQFFSDLNNNSNQNDFDKFLENYTNKFITSWATNVPRPDEHIMYGPAFKIINLLVKAIQESKDFSNPDLIKYQHIPFDEYTLKPLKKIVNELTDKYYKISITSNPSMKFINTPDLYWIMFNAVKKLTKEANVNLIVYDYWAWNDKHNR